MPTIKLTNNAEPFNYTLGNELGRGVFGAVYAINATLASGQALVCKKIKNNAVNTNSRFSRQFSFNCAIHEINMLRKVGILAGYQYDAAQDEFTILMHRAPGITEAADNSENAHRAAYKALRDLHRKGIAHIDCHGGNYIYDQTTNTAAAIDFGFSQERNLITQLIGIMQFHDLRAGFPLKNLITYYIDEMIDYAQNNKMQCAQDAFLMATITIAAITGTSIFGVAGMLAKELFKRYVSLESAKIINSYAHFSHGNADNMNALPIKTIIRLYASYLSIMAGMLLTADISSAYHHGTKVFGALSDIYNTLSPANIAFWTEAAQHVSAYDLGVAMMGLMPLQTLYKTATNFIERNVLPESALVAWTDFNHYAAANTKQVLWSFGQKAKETVQHAVEYICPGQVPTPV